MAFLPGDGSFFHFLISRAFLQESGFRAEFKLYPNVKHTVTKEMLGDIMAFFKKYK